MSLFYSTILKISLANPNLFMILLVYEFGDDDVTPRRYTLV